jgi:hypothetical protein
MAIKRAVGGKSGEWYISCKIGKEDHIASFDLLGSEILISLQQTDLQPMEGFHMSIIDVQKICSANNPLTRNFLSTFFLLMMSSRSYLIVLYAVPLDASNTDRTPTQLANDVFGINVNETQDLVNARSQMLSCSGGKLSYIPACATAEQSCSSNVNQSIWFKNGVLRVPIPNNVTGIASGTVKNWVEAEAQSE